MGAVVGIDIGGTNTKLGLIQYGGKFEVLKQTSIPTPATDPAEKIVAAIARATLQLIHSAGQPVAGVGVGCPGLINPHKGVVGRSPNLVTLENVPLRDLLASQFKLPVEIQNDANAAVLGEYLFSPRGSVENLIMLTLGTGVGGGVVANGRLLEGADNVAAELGHLKVEWENGALCGCGKRGCIEAYAGAAGIARITRDLLAGGAKTALKAENLTTKDIAQAAAAGDRVAKDALFKVGQYLGRGIALLIEAFNPEKVVLGGGASAAFELLRPGIMAAVMEHASFPSTRDRVVIERSAFPDDINIIGAAATYLNAHPESR